MQSIQCRVTEYTINIHVHTSTCTCSHIHVHYMYMYITLHVHVHYIACTLHYMYITLHVYYMYIRCTLHYITCTCTLHYMYITFTLHVHVQYWDRVTREETILPLHLKIWAAQLSCLSGSVGRVSAWYAEHHEFESRLRQIFFSWEKWSCVQLCFA